MNMQNRNLYNRIINSINKAVNETLYMDDIDMDMDNADKVKVVALRSNTLGIDSDLDLMGWGNKMSLIFRLPYKTNVYFFASPNANVSTFSKRWKTIRDIDNALGDGNWEYQGEKKLRGYAHRGTIGETKLHDIEIYSGEYPLKTIQALFRNKSIAVRTIWGYSTSGVKSFIRMLIDEGLIDE